MKKLWEMTWVTFIAVLLCACDGNSDATATSATPVVTKSKDLESALRPHKAEADEGYPLTSVIWPMRHIPTCWQLDSAVFIRYAAQREIVRQAVAATWEAASGVRFIGWEQCDGISNQGISIAVQDTGPHVQGLGARLRNRPGGVVLNFEYANWSTSCQSRKEYCNKTIAVHEFGHVLGFAHEQNRPDTPDPACAAQEEGTQGDRLFGAWDLDSVMNYCNPNWSGDGRLSATDVAMVQAYYGFPAGDQPVIDGPPELIPSIYLLTN